MTIGTYVKPLLKLALWRLPSMLLALALLTLLVSGVGVWLGADISHWSRWVREHRVGFALWRLLVYAATATAWVSMRRRVATAEADAAARLVRVEIAAVIAIIMIEAATVFQT